MIEWMILPYRRYFDFGGRSCRLEFWSMLALIVLFPLTVIAILLAMGAEIDDPVHSAGTTLIFLFGMGSFIPFWALTVRRLHDTGRSGWWFLWVLFPYGFLVVLYWSLLDGMAVENKYGRDPKGRDIQALYNREAMNPRFLG